MNTLTPQRSDGGDDRYGRGSMATVHNLFTEIRPLGRQDLTHDRKLDRWAGFISFMNEVGFSIAKLR